MFRSKMTQLSSSRSKINNISGWRGGEGSVIFVLLHIWHFIHVTTICVESSSFLSVKYRLFQTEQTSFFSHNNNKYVRIVIISLPNNSVTQYLKPTPVRSHQRDYSVMGDHQYCKMTLHYCCIVPLLPQIVNQMLVGQQFLRKICLLLKVRSFIGENKVQPEKNPTQHFIYLIIIMQIQAPI